MVTITALIISIAIALIFWYLVTPGAKQLVEDEWKDTKDISEDQY